MNNQDKDKDKEPSEIEPADDDFQPIEDLLADELDAAEDFEEDHPWPIDSPPETE